jgi:hypothetical protein
MYESSKDLISNGGFTLWKWDTNSKELWEKIEFEKTVSTSGSTESLEAAALIKQTKCNYPVSTENIISQSTDLEPEKNNIKISQTKTSDRHKIKSRKHSRNRQRKKRKHAEQISSSSIYICMNFAGNSVLPLALSQLNFLHLRDQFAVV